MGRYDEIPPEQLRADLVRFARLLLRLDQEDRLLLAVPHIQSLLGDLRQKLFAHEVRGTSNLPSVARGDDDGHLDESAGAHEPSDAGHLDPDLRASLRIVREALARQEEAVKEWNSSGGESEDDHL